ncbi:MAG: hypothetical protein M1832_000032 [Thelocarpon impressellum]|nr:MAG: hypothetical protein M1832_000032 [Thelocarpon impressellum]
MTDEERRQAKRSRFDQTEPEIKRSSRFDRRSRSPPVKESRSRRSRSPLSKEAASPGPEKKPAIDPAAAAAAAAAKIKAQIEARKGIQHVDVPPIRSLVSPTGKSSSPPATSSSNINSDVYIADGDYIKDIEVNDLRNRYTLTKGSTQKMIKEETGADVTTRGNYYPDKSMATAANPPLYLHVTSTSKDGLERAVAKIEELMQQELPNLVDERRFRRREPDQVERDEFGRRKWPEERIAIDLEPVPGFNLRAQVVGHGGAYVKHIQQETRCRVQIKGRGSGFVEQSTGREAEEPMYLHVAGPDPKEVQNAKELCEDLIKNVKEQYERFKSQPPPSQGGFGGGGGYGQRAPDRAGSYGGYGGYGAGASGSPAPPSSAMSPTSQGPPGTTGGAPGASQTDYAAQYAQYYGGQDPYAAYGGYQAYCQYYAYYQQQAAQQGGQAPGQTQAQAPPGAAAGAGAPPPPPSDAAPPPPPPPSGSPQGGYNSVPPPPGL